MSSTYAFRWLPTAAAAQLWLAVAHPAAATEISAATAHGLELVAPKDRWVTRVELRHSGYTRVFDDAGNRHLLGAAYDNVSLGPTVLPALGVFGAGASLGITDASSRLSAERLEIRAGYGITENLTVGVILPFGRTRNNINFRVDGGNIGFNPAFDPALPIGPTNFPFAAVGAGASAPLGTAGVQEILSNPAYGLGYTPLRSTTTEGPSDPTGGFLWRFWRDAANSATVGSGVRLGIQGENDPDNLADLPLDDGSTDLIGQLESVHQLSPRWDLRLQAKRTLQTSDHVSVRVPAAGELLPAYATREQVKRDLGDFWEYDIELGRSLANWRIAGTWHRWDKSADDYDSARGTDTRILETNTDIFADQWRLSLSWSGIAAWQAGKLPLPLIVKFETQQTFAGRNMTDVYDYYLQFTSFF